MSATKEQIEERKQRRRLTQVPRPRAYTLLGPNKEQYNVKVKYSLSGLTFTTLLPVSGQSITLQFEFDTDTVERKVRVYGKIIRDRKGQPVRVQVPLPATFVTAAVAGQKFEARSVCKPPDVYSRRQGIKFSLRRLLQNQELRALIGSAEEDYEAIMRVCLTKPLKISQIRRGEERKKKTAQQ